MFKDLTKFKVAGIGLILGLFLVQIFPGVAFAQSFYGQDYLKQINAVSFSSSNAVVAVIDEGIDFNHPELQNNIWQGDFVNDQNQTIKISGWDFWTDSPDTLTYGSHGTEVAGVIKATAGSNSNIKLMSLAVCKRSYGCDIDNIVKAIYFAVDHGASVINISLSTPDYDSSFDQAIKYAYGKNVVVVAAAGNASSGTSLGANLNKFPVSPVCNDGGSNMVLGVSSVDNSGRVSKWANYGNCVDVYAPASSVYTVTDPAWENGKFYTNAIGTSFAAPQASAVVAQIREKNPQFTAAQIMNLIISQSNKTSGLAVLNVNQTLLSQSSFAVAGLRVPSQTPVGTVQAVAKQSGYVPILPRG